MQKLTLVQPEKLLLPIWAKWEWSDEELLVSVIGTPGYAAPEQIKGAALPQSDFYGLGRTLIHLLTGKHPQELPKNTETGEISWREEASQVSVSFAFM